MCVGLAVATFTGRQSATLFYSNETVATEWVGHVYVLECVYTSM